MYLMFPMLPKFTHSLMHGQSPGRYRALKDNGGLIPNILEGPIFFGNYGNIVYSIPLSHKSIPVLLGPALASCPPPTPSPYSVLEIVGGIWVILKILGPFWL